jgi:hypothetical protein
MRQSLATPASPPAEEYSSRPFRVAVGAIEAKHFQVTVRGKTGGSPNISSTLLPTRSGSDSWTLLPPLILLLLPLSLVRTTEWDEATMSGQFSGTPKKRWSWAEVMVEGRLTVVFNVMGDKAVIAVGYSTAIAQRLRYSIVRFVMMDARVNIKYLVLFEIKNEEHRSSMTNDE